MGIFDPERGGLVSTGYRVPPVLLVQNKNAERAVLKRNDQIAVFIGGTAEIANVRTNRAARKLLLSGFRIYEHNAVALNRANITVDNEQVRNAFCTALDIHGLIPRRFSCTRRSRHLDNRAIGFAAGKPRPGRVEVRLRRVGVGREGIGVRQLVVSRIDPGDRLRVLQLDAARAQIGRLAIDKELPVSPSRRVPCKRSPIKRRCN